MPSLTDPGLLLIEQSRDAIVLHPRQMPGQPGNRIGVMAGLAMHFVECETGERSVQDAANPLQGIEYYILGSLNLFTFLFSSSVILSKMRKPNPTPNELSTTGTRSCH